VTHSAVRTVAALLAALAVAAGAFGSHAASGRPAELLAIGSHYLLIHAVAGFTLAPRFRSGAVLLLGGSAIFAAALFTLALGGPRIFGAVAPVGGSVMILGWLWVAYCASRSRNAATSASDTDLST
jgi:uncharacterized membrane protein YgdD (TMEM256/DUF423 family)